jgi:2-polyprenyl-3-methyl-5-hydroxy-6-metoxy-1,4-benzoquinol methylase
MQRKSFPGVVQVYSRSLMKSLKSIFLRDDRVCPWWLAYTFDNPLRHFLHNPEEILGSLVREGMAVADIGCGMGYFSIAMAKMVTSTGRVIAVDVQQKMLTIMHERAVKEGVAARIHPVLATNDDIKIKDPLDFVLAFWMVHEVNDIPRFFSQAAAALKERGKVLYVEPKLHVSGRRFRDILEHAREARFRIIDGPAIAISRTAILLK